MEAEAYLNRLPMWANKKNSLKDIRIFLDQMGGPDRKIPAIHVAGTNGKGSVCAFMTSVLKKAGLRTGTFISPHLVEIRERFLINGEPAEKNAFEEAFETVKKQAEHMVEEGFCHPTFFEFLFYMAMVLFAREKVDVMVIETGLGGRLDATNVLESPKVCVITSISRDHMQYLGNTIPQIAGEKAGIIKMGVPVVFDDTDKDASAVIGAKAKEMKAVSLPVSKLLYDTEDSSEGILLKEKGEKGLRLSIPFEAPYQAQNAEIAVTALRILRDQKGIFTGITDAVICEGISAARWPGRMEKASENVYLDGAHNPHGTAALIRSLKALYGDRPLSFVYTSMADKDYAASLALYARAFPQARLFCVELEGAPRCESAEILARTAAAFPWKREPLAVKDPRTALKNAMALGNPVILCGSLYFIGTVRRRIKDDGWL